MLYYPGPAWLSGFSGLPGPRALRLLGPLPRIHPAKPPGEQLV